MFGSKLEPIKQLILLALLQSLLSCGFNTAKISIDQSLVSGPVPNNQTIISITSSPLGVNLGGSSYNITFSASDTISGISSLKLMYAADGLIFTDLVILSTSDTSYAWSLPSDNTSSAKLKLVAVNGAGNQSEIISNAFTIDSISPLPPLVSLYSSSPTKLLAAASTVASCTDRNGIYISETSTTPLHNDLGWVACSEIAGAMTKNLSSGDGTKTLYFWAKDSVGNVSLPSSLLVVLDQTAPLPPNIVFSANSLTTLSTTSVTANRTIASCVDLAKIIFKEDNSTPLEGDVGWIDCSTSAIAYSLIDQTEGIHPIKIWSKDSVGNISSAPSTLNFIYDLSSPVVTSVSINSNSSSASTPFVTVSVSAQDSFSSLQVRIQEADSGLNCQNVYANDTWVSYSGVSQDYSFQISTGDGVKKICAWAKDAAGNVSTIANGTGTLNVNMDTINYYVGNPPQITSLTLTNETAGVNFGTQTYLLGDQVRISWSLTDVEGLNNNSIALFYTLNNSTWIPITGSYGITSGNPTSDTAIYTGFNAPASTYFRIKAIAYDNSGNTSVQAFSDTQNTFPWSIFAGSTDRGDGGSGKSAFLVNSVGGDTPKVAIDPKNSDLYAIDDNFGLRKMDSKTGIITTYVISGTTNLAASGTLSASSRMDMGAACQLAFDKRGFLYVGAYVSNRIVYYQINTLDNTYRFYAGGGLDFDTGATPSSVWAHERTAIAFDESNSLYFFTSCSPATFNSSPSTRMVRLLKLTQNSDGTPGTISRIYGGCTAGTIVGDGPMDPLTANTPQGSQPTGSLTAYNNGDVIYFHNRAGLFKIINGVMFRSTISNGMTYNPSDNKIYNGSGTTIRSYTPNLSGANGDTFTTFAGGGSGNGCVNDGVAATSACFSTNAPPIVTPQGKVLIVDGNPGANSKPYRVRYIDSSNNMQTLLGTLPFYGTGLNKLLIRGDIAGIHWKKNTDLNTGILPEGLYFTESAGKVLGRIDPATAIVSLVAGGQWISGPAITTGTTISATTSFGSNGQDDLNNLGFDDQGLPWMKNNTRLLRITSLGTALAPQRTSFPSPTFNYWQNATEAELPTDYGLAHNGGQTNMTLKGSDGVFLFGAAGVGNSGGFAGDNVSIRYFNFATNTVVRVMGDFPGQVSNGVSANQTTPGMAQNLSFSNSCIFSTRRCYTLYREDEDRLYFTEDTTSLRYITNPTNPSASTLGTLFVAATIVKNFIFSTDNSMVFYLDGTKLRCRNLTSGNAWCNDTPLGPSTGMENLSLRANQLTWKNPTTLLISSGGQIFQYTLPP